MLTKLFGIYPEDHISWENGCNGCNVIFYRNTESLKLLFSVYRNDSYRDRVKIGIGILC